jgi:hypothetical protein
VLALLRNQCSFSAGLHSFLSVDPIEGGSCNDYDYVCGDPVNGLDLTGTKKKSKEPLPDLEAHCGYNAPNDIFYGGECLHYRTAKANDDSSIYFDFVGKGRRYDEPHISRIECPKPFRNVVQFFSLGGFARSVTSTDPTKAFDQALEAYIVGDLTHKGATAVGGRVATVVPYATVAITALDAACAAIGY